MCVYMLCTCRFMALCCSADAEYVYSRSTSKQPRAEHRERVQHQVRQLDVRLVPQARRGGHRGERHGVAEEDGQARQVAATGRPERRRGIFACEARRVPGLSWCDCVRLQPGHARAPLAGDLGRRGRKDGAERGREPAHAACERPAARRARAAGALGCRVARARAREAARQDAGRVGAPPAAPLISPLPFRVLRHRNVQS
jgi:hypothetical protein